MKRYCILIESSRNYGPPWNQHTAPLLSSVSPEPERDCSLFRLQVLVFLWQGVLQFVQLNDVLVLVLCYFTSPLCTLMNTPFLLLDGSYCHLSLTYSFWVNLSLFSSQPIESDINLICRVLTLLVEGNFTYYCYRYYFVILFVNFFTLWVEFVYFYSWRLFLPSTYPTFNVFLCFLFCQAILISLPLEQGRMLLLHLQSCQPWILLPSHTHLSSITNNSRHSLSFSLHT